MLTKDIKIIDDTDIFKLWNKIKDNNLNLKEFDIFHFENNKLLKLYGRNYILKYILTNNTKLFNLVLLSGFNNKFIKNSAWKYK